MRNIIKRLKKTKIDKTALIVFAVFALLAFSGIYRCPVRHFFSVPCPCCGITRALSALMAGDIAGSFYYHPLWPFMLLAGIIIIMSELKLIRLPRVLEVGGCILLAAALLICYIIRLTNHTLI